MSALSLALDTPDLASRYDEISSDRQFKAGKVLIERLGLRPGQRVLDVGCGTGLLTAHVADLVGSSGTVIGIDPLPLRIEIAKRKARPNLRFEVGDAYRLEDFAESSFDAVYLNAVFHWLPEKLAPLREFLRVLKPGGRLGIATGSKDHPSRIQLVRRRVLSQPPYADFPEAKAGVAERVSASELRAVFEQAGFSIEQLDVVANTNHHATADAAIEFSQSSSFGNFLGHLPAELQASARAAIRRELDAIKTPLGIRQEGGRLLAVAVKPS